MAFLRKFPRSPYWFAGYTAPDGRRVQRSTKQSSRKKAQLVANEWEKAARLASEKRLGEAQARRVISDIYAAVSNDLRELIRLVKAQRGRLILSGDTRQHGAVAASDALRAIEKHSYPRVAVLRTIRRQDPGLGRSAEEKQFIRSYRAAVKEAASGKIAESFDRLEKLGCVRELPDEPRRVALADEYLVALARDERPLVVAQTWNEVYAANDAIRAALRSAGKLQGGEVLTTYQPLDRSEAQKRDSRFYEPGQSAVFLKRYGRFKKGDLCGIAGANERGVVIVKDGRSSTVSYRYADRIAVAKATEMEIAPGDRLQLKANGRSIEGARLHNGELVTVARVEPAGELVVTDERGATKTLAPSQRLFVRGYAITSYGSQGKTSDIGKKRNELPSTVCTDGKGGLEIYIGKDSASPSPLYIQSVRIHEGVHLLAGLAQNNSLGRDQDGNPLPAGLALSPDSLREQIKGELDATDAQIRFVEKTLARSDISPVERKELEIGLRHAKKYKSAHEDAFMHASPAEMNGPPRHIWPPKDSSNLIEMK